MRIAVLEIGPREFVQVLLPVTLSAYATNYRGISGSLTVFLSAQVQRWLCNTVRPLGSI